MEFILDTNVYRNLARDFDIKDIPNFAKSLIDAEKQMNGKSALSIVVSMELIKHLQSADPNKEECFKALCLLACHTNQDASIHFYPPMNIILTKYFFNSNSKYFSLCQAMGDLIFKLTMNQEIANCDNYSVEIGAVASQVSHEKSEFQKGIVEFISSQNGGELDWSFIHNNEKERDKLFKKINTGQIENLLAISLMLRAYKIMDKHELLHDAENVISRFVDEFRAALKMNTIIFRNIGDGVKGLSNHADKHWNTINDTQILFALLYNGGEMSGKYLVTEDKGIEQACTSSGLGDSLLKIKDYKQLLNID